MTTIDCTAYPRFRATLTPTELHDHFTHTAVICVPLRRVHPRARDVCQGFMPLLPQQQSLVVLGESAHVPLGHERG